MSAKPATESNFENTIDQRCQTCIKEIDLLKKVVREKIGECVERRAVHKPYLEVLDKLGKIVEMINRIPDQIADADRSSKT